MAKQWTAEDVLKVMAIARQLDVDSLNRPIDMEDGTEVELASMVRDDGPDPQELAEQHELHDILMKAVNNLPARQQKIIKLRFGLESGVPMTLEEVGQMYGVTRERIRQIELRAIDRLKWLLLVKYKMKEMLK